MKKKKTCYNDIIFHKNMTAWHMATRDALQELVTYLVTLRYSRNCLLHLTSQWSAVFVANYLILVLYHDGNQKSVIKRSIAIEAWGGVEKKKENISLLSHTGKTETLLWRPDVNSVPWCATFLHMYGSMNLVQHHIPLQGAKEVQMSNSDSV